MDALEKIRAVTGNDLDAIAETTMDILVVVDRDTPVVSGECPMPVNPYPKQFFIITTRVDITALTMNANSVGRTIRGNVTSLPANTSVGWVYDDVSNAWFPLFNSAPVWGGISGLLSNQSDLEDALTSRQATLVSGANIKTINGASILGAGDLVVSAVGTPVWSRVSGSNVTTTGQVLVDITGLSNSLEANAFYEFEAHLLVSTSAVTTGTAYGINFSSAGATVTASIVGSSTNTATKTLRINAFNSQTAIYLATSGQVGAILIKGIIETGGNPGNLTIMHLKLTSGTSTVFINSYLKTIRIA